MWHNWLLQCDVCGALNANLLHSTRHIVIDFDSLSSDDKSVLVLDKGCQHLSVLKSRCGLLDFSNEAIASI